MSFIMNNQINHFQISLNTKGSSYHIPNHLPLFSKVLCITLHSLLSKVLHTSSIHNCQTQSYYGLKITVDNNVSHHHLTIQKSNGNINLCFHWMMFRWGLFFWWKGNSGFITYKCSIWWSHLELISLRDGTFIAKQASKQ